MSDTDELDDTADKDWQAEADKWKNLARKHEEQAKSNADAAKRLTAMEEAQKSAEQKAAEARASAEKERDQARLELLKRDVADAAGLPKSWAARLVGSTKEELEADAKEMAKDLPKPSGPTPSRPVADLKPAALAAGDKSTGSSSADIDNWIRQRARRN